LLGQFPAEQRQQVADIKNMSKKARQELGKEYIESCFDPSKAPTLNPYQVAALGIYTGTTEHEYFENLINHVQEAAGKKLYKYNINQTRSKWIIR
jgi:hypothetical protein